MTGTIPAVPAHEFPRDFDDKDSQRSDVEHIDNVGTRHEAEEVDHKLTKQTVLACIAIGTQINAYIMSLLIPSTLIAYIYAELGPDTNYTWITVSWPLGASVVVSVGGRLSDIFGRRYFMIFGASISIIGCLVGANGKSINMMIASGVLFGIGSGFQEMCYALIQEMLPNKYRIVGVGKQNPISPLLIYHECVTNPSFPRCA